MSVRLCKCSPTRAHHSAPMEMLKNHRKTLVSGSPTLSRPLPWVEGSESQKFGAGKLESLELGSWKVWS